MIDIKNFGETLRELLARKKARSADLEKLLGLQKSKVHRLLYDEMDPSNIGGAAALEKITDLLKLTASEHEELFDSYYTSVGGKNYRAFKNVSAIMNESYISEFSLGNTAPTDIPNGALIKGAELSLIAKNMILSAKKSISILFTPIHGGALFDSLKILNNSYDKQVSVLTYLDPDDISYDENLSVFLRIYYLQSKSNANIRYEYTDISHIGNSSPYPFYIFNETQLLLISEDTQSGIFFSSPSLLSIYKDHFDKKFSAASILFYKLEDLKLIMSFIANDLKKEIRRPVIVLNDAPPAVLSGDKEHFIKFAKSGALPDKFAETLYQWYISVTRNASEIISVCSSDGIDNYLDSEEFYEYSSQFVRSQPKEIRRVLFGNMLESVVSGEINVSVYEKLMFGKVDISIINVLPSGLTLIYSKIGRLFIIKEESIGRSIRSIVEMMKKCELVKSSETAAELMIDAYKKRVPDEEEDQI